MALNCTRPKSSSKGKFAFGSESIRFRIQNSANQQIAPVAKKPVHTLTPNSPRKVIDYRSISHLMFRFQIHFESYTIFSSFCLLLTLDHDVQLHDIFDRNRNLHIGTKDFVACLKQKTAAVAIKSKMKSNRGTKKMQSLFWNCWYYNYRQSVSHKPKMVNGIQCWTWSRTKLQPFAECLSLFITRMRTLCLLRLLLCRVFFFSFSSVVDYMLCGLAHESNSEIGFCSLFMCLMRLV